MKAQAFHTNAGPYMGKDYDAGLALRRTLQVGARKVEAFRQDPFNTIGFFAPPPRRNLNRRGALPT